MKFTKGILEFGSGDGISPGFTGRRYRQAPINSIPCVFAKSEACPVVKGLGKCNGKKHVWEEVPDEAASEPVRPILRCGCCGHYSVELATVQCSGGVTEDWCPKCAEGRAKACAKCGKVHIIANLRQVAGAPDGELWCPECCVKHTEVCPTCGGVAKRGSCTNTVVVDGRGRTAKVCDNCYNQESVNCPDCGERVLKTVAIRVDATLFCARCVERQVEAGGLQVCANCGRYTRSGIHVAGRYYCCDCRAAGCGTPVSGYHGWGGRLTYWGIHGEAEAANPERMYLGFELEAGGGTSSQMGSAADAVHAIDPDEERFHLERDSSIPQYGFELISCPHTLEAHQAYDWGKVLAVLASNGLRSHDLGGKCGLHVHVSRRALSSEDCAKVDLFVSKNQTFLERVSRRASCHYTTYVKKERFEEAGRSTDSVGRYAAVNFTNSRTVEFRMFRGSLRYETLRGVLEIVDGMCHWVKTRTAREIVDNDGEVHRFVSWLRENPERYGFASAYIERRNADIADGEL